MPFYYILQVALIKPLSGCSQCGDFTNARCSVFPHFKSYIFHFYILMSLLLGVRLHFSHPKRPDIVFQQHITPSARRARTI